MFAAKNNLSLISCIEFLQYAPLTDWNFLSVQGIYSAFELDRYERAVLENSWSFLINMISTDLDIIIVCSNSLKSYINSTVRLGITGRLSITGKFEYDLKLTFVWRWYWRCKSMKSLLTVYSPSFLKLDLQFSFNILKSLKSLARDQQTQTRTKMFRRTVRGSRPLWNLPRAFDGDFKSSKLVFSRNSFIFSLKSRLMFASTTVSCCIIPFGFPFWLLVLLL